jgi:hypothetical protein
MIAAMQAYSGNQQRDEIESKPDAEWVTMALKSSSLA